MLTDEYDEMMKAIRSMSMLCGRKKAVQFMLRPYFTITMLLGHPEFWRNPNISEFWGIRLSLVRNIESA